MRVTYHPSLSSEIFFWVSHPTFSSEFRFRTSPFGGRRQGPQAFGIRRPRGRGVGVLLRAEEKGGVERWEIKVLWGGGLREPMGTLSSGRGPRPPPEIELTHWIQASLPPRGMSRQPRGSEAGTRPPEEWNFGLRGVPGGSFLESNSGSNRVQTSRTSMREA